jgi:hypothetical protein
MAERLPGYAPELNPIEYLWGYAKSNELANLAPKDLWELSAEAKKALRRSGGCHAASERSGFNQLWILTKYEPVLNCLK